MRSASLHVPLLLAALVAVGVSVSSPTARAVPVQALTFPPQAGTNAAFINGTDGWEFIPTVDISVTSLGYYDDNESYPGDDIAAACADLTNLSDELEPTYVAALPEDPGGS